MFLCVFFPNLVTDVKALPLHSHKYSTPDSLKMTLHLIWSHFTAARISDIKYHLKKECLVYNAEENNLNRLAKIIQNLL